jgi:hypothetical protein
MYFVLFVQQEFQKFQQTVAGLFRSAVDRFWFSAHNTLLFNPPHPKKAVMILKACNTGCISLLHNS